MSASDVTKLGLQTSPVRAQPLLYALSAVLSCGLPIQCLALFIIAHSPTN